MNKRKIFAACIVLSVAFYLAACDWDWEAGNRFAYDLQGTWVSATSSEVYAGTLVIDYNTITISGYGETLMSLWGDDTKRPFRDFPKEVALEGYSEDGNIFIKKAGVFQIIPYAYDDPGYGRTKLLYFTFGGRDEVLRKEPF